METENSEVIIDRNEYYKLAHVGDHYVWANGYEFIITKKTFVTLADGTIEIRLSTTRAE